MKDFPIDFRQTFLRSFGSKRAELERNEATARTLKASTLNNRGVRSTPGCLREAGTTTLEGSPDNADGARLQRACTRSVCLPGVLATLVPSVTERRPRRGLSKPTVNGVGTPPGPSAEISTPLAPLPGPRRKSQRRWRRLPGPRRKSQPRDNEHRQNIKKHNNNDKQHQTIHHEGRPHARPRHAQRRRQQKRRFL